MTLALYGELFLIHLVIDTNIFRASPDRNSANFHALERLSLSKKVQLYVPYVVEREFQTQQRELCAKDFDKTISGLKGLSRRHLSKSVISSINEIKSKLIDDRDMILSDAEKQFIDWVDSINGIPVPLCIDQATESLEAYFCGKPPLKTIKNREDIPDSFIVRSIEKIHKKNGCLVVIAGDKKVRNSFSEIEDISTYETLSGFIESDNTQNIIKELDLVDNIDDINRALGACEDSTSMIKHTIASSVGESVMWKVIHNAGIPDDNNEATISSFGEAEDIKLDFDDMSYYGNGVFGIPFKLKMEVLADYYIFKADYYGLDPNNLPSVTDHNDHYYEAQEDFMICVLGLATINIDWNTLNLNDISSSFDEEIVEIDEIESIELC